MERRARNRTLTEVPVAFCRLSIKGGAATHLGTMRNCSSGGSYIEVDSPIDEGTIVMLKSSGASDHCDSYEFPEEFRSVSLAEVRWARVIDDDFLYRVGMGLKYFDM